MIISEVYACVLFWSFFFFGIFMVWNRFKNLGEISYRFTFKKKWIDQ